LLFMAWQRQWSWKLYLQRVKFEVPRKNICALWVTVNNWHKRMYEILPNSSVLTVCDLWDVLLQRRY
jgi:hypothetical protein